MKKKIIGILLCMLLIASISIVMVVTSQTLPHDVGVLSIDSPINNGPAQKFPVKVSIKNYGDNQECCFKTKVKIGEIVGTTWILEYEEEEPLPVPPGTIDPGEVIQLDYFPDWTPDFLLEEITGTKTYKIEACTDLPGDNDPTNDCKNVTITLDFWHDIRVNSISSPGACISTGVHTIEAIVENLGTFPEMDLTATAEIVKGPDIVFSETITNIDLNTPLGGTKLLNFGTYDFSILGEGIYELTVCIPLAVDDLPANNCLTQTILVDVTAPSTLHSITPGTPTGNHEWYKGPPSTPVSVTLTATDSVSGVAKIHYTLDGSTWITHTGSGPLTIPVGGCVKPGNFKYKSEDVCGNVEAEKGDSLFKVDTDPPIKHFFNLIFVKVLITKDHCSGLDKIEWTRNGNPWPTTPEYISPSGTNQWRLKIRFGLGSATATVYDMAGNGA